MERKSIPFTVLSSAKICEFTGKRYDAIRITKCNCPCHKGGMMHIVPCCNNGYIEERRYINEPKK